MAVRPKVRHLATSTAIAVSALATTLLPLTPAHATYGPDKPVHVQLDSNDGYATHLARLEGTLAFDDGNRKYRYSLRLCWEHAYPKPYFTIIINGTSTVWPVETGTTSVAGCQMTFVYNAEADFGSTVRNIRFDVTGGWFDSGNNYHMRTKSSSTYDNPYN